MRVPTSLPARIILWVIVALIGAVFGAGGTISHGAHWGPVPTGLLLGILACGGYLVAVRALTDDRLAAFAAAIGMIGMQMTLSGLGPGGSVLVPDTVIGRIWTYATAGMALLVIAWPRLPQRVQSVTAGDASR